MAKQSHRLPWAALWALTGFVLIELLLLGKAGPWAGLNEVIDRWHHLEYGITAGRMEIRSADFAVLPEVFVVGSSRANAGFKPEMVRYREWPEAAMRQVAYGGLKVFELRSLADELANRRPELVVIALSEIDLWSSVQVVPHGSYGSWPAVADLVHQLGLEESWRQRTKFLRMSLEGALRSYRYRVVLQRGLLEPLKRFDFDDRYPRSPGGSRRWNLVTAKPEKALTKNELADLIERARVTLPPDLEPRQIRVGIQQVHAVTRGPHVAVQQHLFRRTVETLLAAGSAVLIVEPPLHPITAEIYDTSIRGDFLEFVAQLQAEYPVGFLSIEDSGPYPIDEFHDITHLDIYGAARFTRAIMAEIENYLPSSASD